MTDFEILLFRKKQAEKDLDEQINAITNPNYIIGSEDFPLIKSTILELRELEREIEHEEAKEVVF